MVLSRMVIAPCHGPGLFHLVVIILQRYCRVIGSGERG
jgi:hypothetical protein